MDHLEALNPLNVLRRGYSIARWTPSMEILRDARRVKKGDMVDVRLHRGRLVCKVEKTRGDS